MQEYGATQKMLHIFMSWRHSNDRTSAVEMMLCCLTYMRSGDKWSEYITETLRNSIYMPMRRALLGLKGI